MTATRGVPRSPWFRPLSLWRSIIIQPRVYLGAAAGIAAPLFLPKSMSTSVREAAAWCCGGATYLMLALQVMRRFHSDRIQSRAARQDDSGIVILGVILLAVFSSFAAIFGLVTQVKTASGDGKMLYLGLAAATIFISWSVMQVVFTLHYAHEHYAPHNLSQDSATGLAFPADAHPDYWDFLYFAISIGAASQTSDVDIRSKALRRLVTLHAAVAFFFNTMVLAMTINLAAGMASG
jgi:uncharacterized membrane protein